MRMIKLNATDSTNSYLKERMAVQSLEDFTVVVAGEQRKGRGQRGTEWESEAGMNLTFSVLKKMPSLEIADQFVLNQIVSLAVYRLLQELRIPEPRIKWPNDIMSGSSKICGILIENILKGKQLQASIIGIGLNVNQMHFPGLPHVSSLRLLSSQTYSLPDLLTKLLGHLERAFDEQHTSNFLKESYENALFGKDQAFGFEEVGGPSFSGSIRGISSAGKLRVQEEGGRIREFDMKEIVMKY